MIERRSIITMGGKERGTSRQMEKERGPV